MIDKKLSNVGEMINIAVDNSKSLKEGILKAEWLEIVGRVGNESQPEYIKDGVLTITVESPIFIHHFIGKKKEYIEKINQYFNRDLVQDIDIRSGTLDEKRSEYLNRDVSYENEYEDEEKTEDYDDNDYTKDDDFEEDYESEFDKEVYKEDEFDKEFEAEKEAEDDIDEEIPKPKSDVETFDLSPEGIAKRIKYLEELSKKREKFLISKGYKKCKGCGVVFEPTENEEFCKVCTTAKLDRKIKNNF